MGESWSVDSAAVAPGSNGDAPVAPAVASPAVRTILIAALGGEGGGVLVDWLVDGAQRAGLAVQATSVPGVAQRTGSTSYYFECATRPSDAAPVFALLPVPGCVDVLVSSELLETARMIERGFVTPTRTLLITATHRVHTTAEKMQTGDGRFASPRLLDAAHALARRCLAIDLRTIAESRQTVISAAMFGALAGSGALPWSREVCEDAIRAGGVGVDRSLAGFGAACTAATAASDASSSQPGASATALQPAAAEPGLDEVMALANARLTDFQDAAHARRHAERVASLVAVADGAADPAAARAVVIDAARELALWMAYEDLIRVADLKTRRSRLVRVRAEAQAGPGDVVRISEHFSPGIDEIAAILPRRLGLALLSRFGGLSIVGTRGRGWRLTTSSIAGFVLLRLLAGLRPWRPGSLRFAQEQAAITEWLAALAWALAHHTGWAAALTGMPRLRKGYSDTHARGLRHFDEVMAACVRPLLAAQRPPTDADAQALREAIAARRTVAAATRPDPAIPQPVVWRPRKPPR